MEEMGRPDRRRRRLDFDSSSTGNGRLQLPGPSYQSTYAPVAGAADVTPTAAAAWAQENTCCCFREPTNHTDASPSQQLEQFLHTSTRGAVIIEYPIVTSWTIVNGFARSTTKGTVPVQGQLLTAYLETRPSVYRIRGPGF